MAHVIATINLKGGVGKTTTSVGLAETFSAELGKKVLVIDLDPQTNATTMLIGEESWGELNSKEYTLARLFKDALEPDKKKFKLASALQKKVSDVTNALSIDLLPSSLDLIDIQDRLHQAPGGKYYSNNPVEILFKAVKPIVDDYDVVVVDCPPNLGIITLNGLRIAEGYIIPTIPDPLSTYGIPQITARVQEFSEEIVETIEPLGVIVTKYQANSTVHQNGIRQLKAERDAPLFKTIIRQANQIAAAAEHRGDKRTLRQKYGSELAGSFIDLAKELWDKLEG